MYQINEEEFLQKVAISLDMMNFNTKLVETEDYPLSIESKLLGYENLPIDICIIFLPLKEIFGEEVQLLQLYFSLYNQDVSEDILKKLKELFNFLNMNSAVGTFGVQEGGLVCYKQAVVLRGDRDAETNLQTTIDNIMLMALNLDNVYSRILSAIED